MPSVVDLTEPLSALLIAIREDIGVRSIEGYLKLNSKKYRLITALNESEKVRSGRR